MTKNMIILGTGGNCIDILDTIHEINEAGGEIAYECGGFLDDHEGNWGKELHGLKVLGPLESATAHPGSFFVNGIGSPLNFWQKKDILARTRIPDERFETIIHPSASVSRMARLGRGTVVFQNVTITSGVEIGNHVIILPNSVISHSSTIGDYSCLAGAVCIAGYVTIGPSCYLGMNSAIAARIAIGANCLVGMGSVVLHDVEPDTVVVGNPARFLRKTLPEKEEPRFPAAGDGTAGARVSTRGEVGNDQD